jgi:two-component system, cell cycle sensor histidine kinase and response regulator CckA
VVDDEAAICEIAKNILEAHNYRVLLAKDGIEAIALYVQYKSEISLLLMDSLMPSMDGLNAIRTLKKLVPQIRIVAMSGLDTDDKRDRLFEAGIQKFLSKPFTAEELLNVLRDELEVAAVVRRSIIFHPKEDPHF